jgi:hypothetical protein
MSANRDRLPIIAPFYLVLALEYRSCFVQAAFSIKCLVTAQALGESKLTSAVDWLEMR